MTLPLLVDDTASAGTRYAAIGEADSRLRKPVTLNHAIQRLMVLDAIVEDPDLVWLGTRRT